MVFIAFLAACHAPLRMAPAPSVALTREVEGQCWWTVYRSPLPADSVAARYVRAYESIGLGNATWSHTADTAWAQAGPATLGETDSSWTYAARVVAYQRGDSAHFRTYASATLPKAQSVTDSARALGANPETGRRIAFCGRLARIAQVQGTAPRDPDGEEKLDVWRRR